MPSSVNNHPRLRFPFFSLIAALALASCGESTTIPEYGDGCTGTCPTLTCLEDSFFPGGLCTESCAEDECGAGGVCDDRWGTALCLAECSDDAECREGWDCWRGGCQPACESDGECGAGAFCTDGRCGGTECTSDAHCPGSRCDAGSCVPIGPVDMGPPPECEDSCEGICLSAGFGGGCAQRCTDALGCPSGTNCSPVPTDSDGDGSVDRVDPACVPFQEGGRFAAGSCGATAAPSTSCDSRVCFQGQCVISCDDDADCLAGQSCQTIAWDDATFSTCFDVPGLENGDLELRRGGLSTGVVSEVTFAAPRNATSMALVLQQTDGTELPLTFVSVIDPREQSIFDLDAIAMLEDQPIRWLPISTNESATMLVPNSTADRVSYRNGRHRVSYAAFSPEGGGSLDGDVSLVARFASGNGRRLRLHFHIAPGIGITAANAPSSSRLQNAIAAMAATYAAANISVEVAGYSNVSGTQFTIIDSTEGPSSEMAQLFARGTTSGDVLDVFLVRAIDTGAGSPLGVAGGIPGPPGLHGTLNSGVVAAYDSSVVGGSSNLGQIIAHEVGHYLGLFHSTENGDPCRPGEFEGCAPFGGGDPISDTSRGDNRNMMFFALQTFGGGTTNNRISAGQQFVLQRNPVVLR